MIEIDPFWHLGNLNKCITISSQPICTMYIHCTYVLVVRSYDTYKSGITVGPGKFVKKNKHRALNKRRA